MKFLADMGVSPKVVGWLRSAGHDAVHLREQGLQRLADDDVFAKAQAENRILLTFDLDFGEIVVVRSRISVGVVVFRLRNTRTEHVIERLSDVLVGSANALSRAVVIVVEDARYRVRGLSP